MKYKGREVIEAPLEDQVNYCSGCIDEYNPIASTLCSGCNRTTIFKYAEEVAPELILPGTIDSFIIALQAISKDKRKLPLVITCPNGLQVYPEIKMQFDGLGSPLLGNKLEKMVITY